MANPQNTYFLSDAHLGIPDHHSSLKREKMLINWLEQVAPRAEAIYLLGDIFDYWFEYKKVVPKGHVRLLGAIAKITDQGTPVYFFPGNHDLWVRDYFTTELGMIIHPAPVLKEISGKQFYIAHGDGLGKGDKGYKLLKNLFTCQLCRWLFAQIHPDLAIRIAHAFSKKSRMANAKNDEKYHGPEKEILVQFAKNMMKDNDIEFFVFGHRHLPLKIELDENTTFFNLGEWYNLFTYGVFDGEQFRLEYFQGKD